MGVTIKATNSSRSFDMGFGGFMSLRTNIAKAFDKEFGEHYDTLSTCWKEEHYKAFDERTNEILKDPRFKEEDVDIIEFFFASDCEGSISHKTCKKIYNIIKDIDFEGKIFVYAAHSDGKDYEYFKEFLLECWKNRRKMRWC